MVEDPNEALNKKIKDLSHSLANAKLLKDERKEKK